MDDDYRIALDPLYVRGYEAGRRFRQNADEWRGFALGLLSGAVFTSVLWRVFA